MLSLILALVAAQAPNSDRTYEGDWYVSDVTNNNTGEREVDAMAMHLEADDPDYVTLRMRCTIGMPTFSVDWADITVPDQTVLSIGPIANGSSEPAFDQYIFEKSTDPVHRGLRASPDTSAKLVKAFGSAKLVIVTVHASTGTRSVTFDVDGSQRAWARVSRHCPVRKMPTPPM